MGEPTPVIGRVVTSTSAGGFGRFIVGDSLTVLRSMPDASVDLVLSSPPFLALRAYLPSDHPNKAQEMGSEPTPGAYLDALLDVVEECRRILTPHGSLCFELGDTYSGSGGAGGDYTDTGLRAGQEKFEGSAIQHRRTAQRNRISRTDEGYPVRDDNPRPNRNGRTRSDGNGMVFRGGERQMDHKGDGWPLEKSLCLVPEMFRFALVYGFNPLTGRSTPRWRARNVVRWCRPNPPVGALGDKVRPATSDMVIACVSGRRFFDLDAVRSDPREVKDQRFRTTNGPKQDADPSEVLTANYHQRVPSNPAGAPPLDHWWFDDVFEQDAWLINTQPYKGSHYATWPEELCQRPIKAMCPQRVCTDCGRPSERITEASYVDSKGRPHERQEWASGIANGQGAHSSKPDGGILRQALTSGWTDCGHDSWRAGIVLDPFAGSGTTLAVAISEGRSGIGIDLDERNAMLAEQRVGMFLVVEHPSESDAQERVTDPIQSADRSEED